MHQRNKKTAKPTDNKPENMLKRVLVVAEIVNTALSSKQASKTQE